MTLPRFLPKVRFPAFLQLQLKAEGAAFTHPAGHGDISSHHPGIVPADGHSQAGAVLAFPPRRRLLEILEDLVLFILGYARAGVLDFHHQAHLSRCFVSCRNPQDNAALVREFHGIAQQIDQHLPEFALVRDHITWQIEDLAQVKGDAFGIGPDVIDFQAASELFQNQRKISE